MIMLYTYHGVYTMNDIVYIHTYHDVYTMNDNIIH